MQCPTIAVIGDRYNREAGVAAGIALAVIIPVGCFLTCLVGYLTDRAKKARRAREEGHRRRYLSSTDTTVTVKKKEWELTQTAIFIGDQRQLILIRPRRLPREAF